jgi:2-dehydropantoate 2-reductase
MFPRIAIVGAGAVGGYYGARLARAGAEVHFLLRSDLATVRAHGLKISAPDGDFTLAPVRAHATPAEIGPCELVIIALKATAGASLAGLLPPLLHERTALLTLQNGIGPHEELAARFGAHRLMGGLCYVCINRHAPGEIACTTFNATALGEWSGPATPRLHALAELFDRAGLKPRVTGHFAEQRWGKLVWNIPFNGLAIAGGGVTTDRILASPALSARARRLMDELIAAAPRLGFTLPANWADRQFRVTEKIGAYQPSSLVDYLAGREVEVEAIWGEPLRQAEAAGAAMPELTHLHRELLQLTHTNPRPPS